MKLRLLEVVDRYSEKLPLPARMMLNQFLPTLDTVSDEQIYGTLDSIYAMLQYIETGETEPEADADAADTNG
jgi:hypothetical protein